MSTESDSECFKQNQNPITSDFKQNVSNKRTLVDIT